MENVKFKNQMEAVKWHLENKPCLTSFEAFTEYGITRLSAKIFNLRKSGWNIISKNVTTKNRYGLKCNYSEYCLVKEEN